MFLRSIISSLHSVQNSSSQVNNFEEDISKLLCNKSNEQNLEKNNQVFYKKKNILN